MYRYIERERNAGHDGMHVHKKLKRSPHQEDGLCDEDGNEKDMTSWVRGSWYNPPANGNSRFDGKLPSFFLSSPPSL